jgi:peptidyl-tRNA hydrolase, PTH1 family
MYYIVGLGNPGEKYAHTRHNVGSMFVQYFQTEISFPSFHESKSKNALLSQGVFRDAEVTLLLPLTFMNASGAAVAKIVPKTELHTLVVVYDDIDLPLGEVKVSFGRGDGGHNGVKSIIEKLGSKEFVRIRVGIGTKSMWSGKLVRPKGEALAAYVLKQFTAKEEKVLEDSQKNFADMVSVFITKGKDALMNSVN